MIVILGSGLSGYGLATELRQRDAHVPITLITADDGAYYAKPSLSTALAQKKTPQGLVTHTAESMSKTLNVQIRTHTWAAGIDQANQQVVLKQGAPLQYQHLVLACGAQPMGLAPAGDGAQDILSVNDLTDYALFRERIQDKKKVLIVGSGLVGCEFAHDLCQVGYHVDVVGSGAYPVDKLLPEHTAQALQASLSTQGVTWHFHATVHEIMTRGPQYQVVLSTGTRLVVDVVLSAVGLRPNTDLAQAAGLATNNGIVVDDCLQTQNGHIYALGDCASVNGVNRCYVAPLRHGAKALAKTLCGDRTAVHYPPMPITLKTPTCPVVVCPPHQDQKSEWVCTGSGPDRKAVCYDSDQTLIGFALTGQYTKERMQLTQAMRHL